MVSDIHIPQHACSPSGWVRETIEAAEHTIHAGDIGSRDSLDQMRALTEDSLVAVRGDKDSDDITFRTHD